MKTLMTYTHYIISLLLVCLSLSFYIKLTTLREDFEIMCEIQKLVVLELATEKLAKDLEKENEESNNYGLPRSGGDPFNQFFIEPELRGGGNLPLQQHPLR